jgi:hypothetical protein
MRASALLLHEVRASPDSASTHGRPPWIGHCIRREGARLFMDFLQSIRGWRRIWLVAAVAYPLLLMAVAYSVFPSRADIERAWLNKAIDIEKQFDPSTSGLNHAMLRARFAGVPDRVAVNRIRDDLYKAEPPARPATRQGYLGAGAPGTLTQHPTGRLIWFDPAHTLTREGLDYLRDEFARADVLFQHKLSVRPRQMLHAALGALSLAGFTLALLYVFGLLVEFIFGARAAVEAPRLHSHRLGYAWDEMKEALGSLRPRI